MAELVFYLSCILAAFSLLWHTLRPLWVAFGQASLKQDAEYDPEAVQQLARERGQDDELETLLVMGFRPLGRIRIRLGFLDCDRHGDALVVVHQELPVSCHMRVAGDRQLTLMLYTDDGQGHFVCTSTSWAGAQIEAPDFLAQVADVRVTEEVLVKHMQAVDERRETGFRPVLVRDLQDAARQSKEANSHHEVLRFVRRSCWQLVAEILPFLLLFPAVMTLILAAGTLLPAGGWQIGQVVQIYTVQRIWSFSFVTIAVNAPIRCPGKTRLTWPQPGWIRRKFLWNGMVPISFTSCPAATHKT